MSKKSSNFAPNTILYNKMRHLFAIIATLCIAVNVMAQNEEPIIIVAPDTTIDKTAYTLEDQGITISVSYGSAYPATHNYNNLDTTYFACLANGNITFSAEQAIKGIAINGWVRKNFSASSDKGTLAYLSDEYDDTTGEPVMTLTDVDATSVTISCNNQLRCFSVEVYFSKNPGLPDDGGEVVDTVRIVATTAIAADYSEDPDYSYEGHYSYWLKLAPATGYPEIWLDMYASVKGDLSGTYSLYDFNVGDYTYVQLSADEQDYEYAYDQEFTITKNGNEYHIDGYIIADNDVQYEFVYDGPVTFDKDTEGIESVEENVKATKMLRDGQLIIRKNGRTFTATGIPIQ